MSMTQEAREEVEKLIRQGNKLLAIKYLHDTFHVSLQEGKMLVEALENEIQAKDGASKLHSFSSLEGDDRIIIENFIRQKKKIEAVKYVHKKFNLGLKESVLQVELIQKEIDPHFVPSTGSGCKAGMLCIFGFIFGFVGLLLLGVGILLYAINAEIVKDENKTEGIVTALSGSGTVAPTFSYTWKGQSYEYVSTLASSPPAFDLHERVALYVNPEKPEEIVVDTFSERWLAITIFVCIGGVFTFLSIIFFFSSRKF